jgi:DNA-binding NtrC family response regulator
MNYRGEMTEAQKILVVEDEPVVRSLCKAALKHYGFEPILASDGAEGLEIYRRLHPEIALVLSDLMMPKLSGLEMVDGMFAINRHANIILMTGYDSHSEVPERLQKVCALLDKPFSVQELIRAVRKCLEAQALNSLTASP